MPYGFENYLTEKKKRKPTTIDSYIKILNLFFNYLHNKYKNDKEMYEVNPSDIKEFIMQRVNSGIKVSTANKDLAILKTFFDYLWKKNIVPIDPAHKIERLENPYDVPDFLPLATLEDIKLKLLDTDRYHVMTKTIFILGVYGLQTEDFKFTKEQVVFNNNGIVLINLPNRTIDLTKEESIVFKEYYNTVALTKDTPFVFSSKKHKKQKQTEEDCYVPIEVMTLLSHLRKVSNDFNLPIRLTFRSIRWSLGYELNFNGKHTPEEVAKILGVEVITNYGCIYKFNKIKKEIDESFIKYGVYKAKVSLDTKN